MRFTGLTGWQNLLLAAPVALFAIGTIAYSGWLSGNYQKNTKPKSWEICPILIKSYDSDTDDEKSENNNSQNNSREDLVLLSYQDSEIAEGEIGEFEEKGYSEFLTDPISDKIVQKVAENGTCYDTSLEIKRHDQTDENFSKNGCYPFVHENKCIPENNHISGDDSNTRKDTDTILTTEETIVIIKSEPEQDTVNPVYSDDDEWLAAESWQPEHNSALMKRTANPSTMATFNNQPGTRGLQRGNKKQSRYHGATWKAIRNQEQYYVPENMNRCSYWPTCTNSHCRYTHPIFMCPNNYRYICEHKDRCPYLHYEDIMQDNRQV